MVGEINDYVLQNGTGIQKILDECREAGLPEPEWREDQGAIWVTFRKDILTEEFLRSLGLDERQVRAVLWARRQDSITNRQYRELNEVSNKTAYLELTDLARRGLLRQEGTGRTLRYVVLKVTQW